MKKHLNTFDKGLNRDYSKNKFPNNCYYNAEGLRLVTNDGLSSFALTNIEGNTLSASLDSGWTIHGQQAWCVLRNKLIILAIGSTPGTNDRIYQFTITSTGALTSKTILYTGNLGFNIIYPIKKLIGVFESDTIQKIYWTDGYNRIKFCNIADVNLSSYVSTQFDIIPAFTQSNISISNLTTGNLKSGAVQYSYQLYNLYGTETNFTTPSSLINLCGASVTGSDILFNGDKEGGNSGKGVVFQINNVDTTFNRIKVIRILYTSLLADPEITIIEDTSTESSMSFTDIGTQNLGNYTLEEFNFLKYDFICQDLETKNNILFAGNIQESIWDVEYDARAYRFGPNGGATLYAADGVSDPIDITDTNLKSGVVIIPETHDCYNIYNDWTQDNLNREGYKYKGDATTIGGEGINISYTFSNSSNVFTLDSNTSSVVINTNHATGNVDPIHVSDNIGYQADEIYPFAIVLLNTKGQRSYPKWIGDIRFPRRTDGFTNLMAYGVAGYNMYISFTVSNLPTDCVGFQIVRCERTASDRTIVAQGLIGATRVYNGDTTFNCPPTTLSTVRQYLAGETLYPYQQSKTLNKQVLEFISPEIVYNKNMKYSGGDMLEIVGIVTNNHKFVKTDNDTNPFVDNLNFNYRLNRCLVVNKCNDISNIILGNIRRTSVTDFKIVDSPDDRPINETIASYYVTIGTSNYENYVRGLKIQFGMNAYKVSGKHGTTGILSTNANLDLSSIIDTSYTYGNKYVLCNYKRAVIPYGGASYEARSRRTYIPCSDIYTSEGTYKIKRGDTFVTKFEYQRVMSVGLLGQLQGDETLVEVIQFPVETSINTRWQYNKTFTQLYANTSNVPINTNAAIIQEKAGLYEKDNRDNTSEWINVNFSQTDNLYSYNSVYSKQNNTTKFHAKPLDVLTNPKYDNRVMYSGRKFSNENTDSFTKFKPLNCKDVDSQYGPINALTNYNTDLMFFQDSGWGILSVEERELLPGSNGVQLTTGTGGILSRFDYVSTNGGCKYPNSIFRGRYSMYFYDSLNYSLFSFIRNGGDNNLSKLLGVQSFLNKNVINNNLTDVITGYNPKYNEVMFTFSANTWNDNTYKTIVFNEKDKQFTRIDQINPSIYLNLPEHLHETSDNLNIYQRNIGNFGQFFGNYYPSKITLLINPDSVLVNRFDIIQWITEFSNINHKTFDAIRFYNDYQDSGTILLVDDNNLFYVFRTWRFNQFFDADENRIKDSYMMVELTYNNTSNDKLVVHDIITTYSPTIPF